MSSKHIQYYLVLCGFRFFWIGLDLNTPNLVSWSAKRQPILSCSSAEAEYHGDDNVVAESCWLQNLLLKL